MYTTINKFINPSEMVMLFNSPDLVYVKFFTTKNFINKNTKTRYQITIRHTEKENPKTLFNNALKNIRQ